MSTAVETIELENLPEHSGISSKIPTPPLGSAANLNAPVSTILDDAAERARGEEAVSLPPVDSGVQAWTFVFCAFILECLVWGFPFSYGVFQEWYLSSPDSPFRGASEAAVNAIGTITLGIQYMEGIALMFFTQRFPQYMKTMMACALVVCVGALVVSSFATQVWHLIVLQGVVYGIAGGALYTPVVGWLSEWFVRRRSFAGSFIFGGSGLGGAGFPILANFLLQRVGFRWTLRVLALLVGVLGGGALIGAKPRLPVARRTTPAPLSFQFVSQPLFIAVAVTIFVQALAYFPVSLYIPSYAATLGYSRLNGTLALTAFNLATVVGQIMFGYYCDKGPYTTAMIGSGLSAAVIAFGLWGFAHNLTRVYVFAVVFGGISGGFSSVWPPAAADLYAAQSFSPFLFFACSKGLAAISGPFIAASLHPTPVGNVVPGNVHAWAGFGFTGMTIFVGGMMMATTALSLVCTGLRIYRDYKD
ncbi:major facilitator superfamily domain-containing protein [Vararia minispora EC-137]|uniref:Major facilitator superfamily domain-containing protein n=1 Tax=Vararia minispora EC-137 TaxID=1314806 RepID=A0ACB8QPH6_9AGAM|nr:major facilitator superfamily domain-containing protein [Vararia minispora EC-137]